MRNLKLGGACPRRPITHAIPRAMMHPTAPVDVALGHNDLGVFACNGTFLEAFEALAAVGRTIQHSWLAACFTDNVSTQLRGLLLLRPVANDFYVCLVDPCQLQAGAPMMLVTADRAQAFELDGTGRFVERRVPPPAKLAKGIDRAWAELTRRMLAVTTETGEFRHSSWVLCLPEETAPSH